MESGLSFSRFFLKKETISPLLNMPMPFCVRISRRSGFLLFPIILISAIFSCNQKTEIPFPDNPNGWQTPKAVPFSFPEETPIRWDTLNANYLPKKTTLPFVIEQMPSKPFAVNDFAPISQPIAEIPFVFEKLKSIAVNLDSVKADTFAVRKFLVPPPQINLATIPSVWRGGTSGLVKLGQAEGLVGNRILAMFSDSLGVTWITTEQGLNKYDGRTFAFFNFFQKDQTGATETLSDIVQDTEGNLLISSESSGIYRFNPVLGMAEHFRTGHGYIRIELDSKGQLWGSGTHLYKIDLEQKTEIPLKVSDPDYSLAFCYGVNSDADGNLWIGYQNTIGILAPDQKSFDLSDFKKRLR